MGWVTDDTTVQFNFALAICLEAFGRIVIINEALKRPFWVNLRYIGWLVRFCTNVNALTPQPDASCARTAVFFLSMPLPSKSPSFYAISCCKVNAFDVMLDDLEGGRHLIRIPHSHYDLVGPQTRHQQTLFHG